MVEESKLKALLEDHLKKDDPHIAIDLEKDGEVIHQVVDGMHNVTSLTEDNFDQLQEQIRNKKLDIIYHDPETGNLAFLGYEEVGKDTDLIKEILSLRNMSLTDIEKLKTRDLQKY